MKHWGALAALLAVLSLVTLGGIYVSLPPSPPSELATRGPVTAVPTGSVISYIVSLPGQPVVLINSGDEPNVSALLSALGELNRAPEDVKAILLTHGSYDHSHGLKRFPKATVYASSDDLNLADHVRRISSALPRLRMRLFGRPERPQRMRTVLPGERITIGSLVFDSLPLPGVTAGSLAYRYDRFVFVGDSLWPTEQGLEPPSGLWLERASELRHSLSRLESWEGDWIATSRGGFSEMPASWSP